MSKVRLVVAAVVVEGRTHAEVAAHYGLSRSLVTKLVARWRVEGDTAFESRSRRPRRSPAAIGDEVVELIVNLRAELSGQGLDAGPHTIAWHLQHRHGIATCLKCHLVRVLEERSPLSPPPHDGTPTFGLLTRALERPSTSSESTTEGPVEHWALASDGLVV